MNDTTRLLSLALPLFVAPLAGCEKDGPATDDTDVVDTDTVVDSDTDVDTDVDTDTDVVPDGCGDGTPEAGVLCFDDQGVDAGGDVAAVAIGDFDGEGADVLYGVGNKVRMSSNDGVGVMSEALDVHTMPGEGTLPQISDLALGQLDADGNLDFAVASSNWNLELGFGGGDGTVPASFGMSMGEGYALDVDVADLGGSGATDDFLSANGGGGCGSVILTDGEAGYDALGDQANSTLCSPRYAAIAKTSNAYSSAVGVEGSTLKTWWTTATPTELTVAGTPGEITLQDAGSRVVAADLDGDGWDDLVVPLASGVVDVLFSDGESGWRTQPGDLRYVAYELDAPASDAAVGDLDGDGDPDVALVGPTLDALVVLLNDGEGGFTATEVPLQAGAEPSRVAAGDLNGDGVDDLALATAGPEELTVLVSDP